MTDVVILCAFLLITLVPGAYGIHMYVLTALALRRSASARAAQKRVIEEYTRATAECDWPIVTSQIPLYNERLVARRVMHAVAAMEYPRGRHQIQVLDDSTDQTGAIVDRVASELRAAGHDVEVVRRPVRAHYKAGALAHGLARSRGEFVAIFDADFAPSPQFLRRMIPLIASDAGAACAQARWGHLNESESWVTRAIALGIDGHFGVEQSARAWNGMLLNFNGTAGVWRRSAIEDARVGGWSGDTVTEDLDLSYRAQLAGWRILYHPDECVPGEIPADVDALKAQQRRWATGSMQTARKLLPRVLASRLTWMQKLEACVHLTQYSVNVFMVLMALVARGLAAALPEDVAGPWLSATAGVILVAALGPSVAYSYARWALTGRAAGPVAILRLIVVGFGLSLNNCLAVVAGLFQRGGEFVRTPKTGAVSGRRVEPNLQAPASGAYAAMRSRLWIIELLLGAHCLIQWVAFLPVDHYIGGTFLLLAGAGLLTMGWQSRPQSWRRQPTVGTAPATSLAVDA